MNPIITLNAGVKSDLSWQKEKELAYQLIKDGKKILWHLDLGLFSNLIHDFSHQGQFHSLSLSIDHFKNEIWPHFRGDSLGMIIYKGPMDFSTSFPWDEIQKESLKAWINIHFPSKEALKEEINYPLLLNEIHPEALSLIENGKRLLALFCRDVCLDYLHLLADGIPDEISIFAHLEREGVIDPILLAQLTTAEKYRNIIPILDIPPEWNKDSKIALCLPSSEFKAKHKFESLSKAFSALSLKSIPYKIIPENSLIMEWDELDYLIVSSNSLGAGCLRKLQGFCAAGGTVVFIGDSLNLPLELPFNEWIHSLDTSFSY